MDDNRRDIKLDTIIDINILQKIQDAFAKATGMAALSVDLDGPVTTLSNGTEFCMELNRKCKEGARRCNQCDLNGGNEANRTKKPSIYYCHAGLMDFAAPILVGDKQIGSLIGGQVLSEPYSEEKIRSIARELDIDEDVYINAISKINIVPKEKINAAAELLFVIANTISNMGYQRYKIKNITYNLYDVSKDIIEDITSLSDNINTILDVNSSLAGNFDQLQSSANESSVRVSEVDEVVNYIKGITKQTNLLGLNASIEAAKANESGAGFEIIAREIRKLSQTTREQSDKISSVLEKIKSSIYNMENQIENTHDNFKNNNELILQISDIVNTLNNTEKSLEEFKTMLNEFN